MLRPHHDPWYTCSGCWFAIFGTLAAGFLAAALLMKMFE